MNIFCTGCTGFIGKDLVSLMLKKNWRVVVATRYPDRLLETSGNIVGVDSRLQYVDFGKDWLHHVNEADAVINLAGESLFGKRWTPKVKKVLRDSRVGTTQRLVDALKRAEPRPRVFISASAVGYYGNSGDQILDEQHSPGDDFMADICVEWESTAMQAKNARTRVSIPRIGVVLGGNGGALAKLIPLYKFYLGGPVGSGNQYFPWIHIGDLSRALLHAVENDMEGPFNAVSPEPLTMNEFSRLIGQVWSRPSWFRVPQWLLNLSLGESSAMLTNSLKVIPSELKRKDFDFDYPDLKGALEQIREENKS